MTDALLVSAKIAAIFTQDSGQGPTMAQDSAQLFKSDNTHGNYATTAFSWSAWQAARIECMKQAELGSAKRQALEQCAGLQLTDRPPLMLCATSGPLPPAVEL